MSPIFCPSAHSVFSNRIIKIFKLKAALCAYGPMKSWKKVLNQLYFSLTQKVGKL